MGTWVKITRIDRQGRLLGDGVVIRINDRGPFSHQRIVDVSFAAARTLGMIGPGVLRVQLQVVEPPTP